MHKIVLQILFTFHLHLHFIYISKQANVNAVQQNKTKQNKTIVIYLNLSQFQTIYICYFWLAIYNIKAIN